MIGYKPISIRWTFRSVGSKIFVVGIGYFHFKKSRYGRTGGNRTLDQLVKSQLLYQLSYGPMVRIHRIIGPIFEKVKPQIIIPELSGNTG